LRHRVLLVQSSYVGTGEMAGLESSGWEVNQPCAVLSGGEWYRGLVTAVDEEQNVFEVQLVDVGQREQTSRVSLRLLQPRDLIMPPVSLLRLQTQFHNSHGML